jgi:Uncharacterized conserved protein
VTKFWQPYAQHILDAIAKIRRIQGHGDLMRDEILYDATLRNLQTLSEATQQLPSRGAGQVCLGRRRQSSVPLSAGSARLRCIGLYLGLDGSAHRSLRDL